MWILLWERGAVPEGAQEKAAYSRSGQGSSNDGTEASYKEEAA